MSIARHSTKPSVSRTLTSTVRLAPLGRIDEELLRVDPQNLGGGARAQEADEGVAALDHAPGPLRAEHAREIPLEVMPIPLDRGPELLREHRELHGPRLCLSPLVHLAPRFRRRSL